MSLNIPVLIYRRRVTAAIHTFGQFSKISQELGSYSITKGAEFQEIIYYYNEVRKRVDTVLIPISTRDGAATKEKYIVDRNLKGSSAVLGLTAIRKLGFRLIVGNISARINIRTIRMTREDEVDQVERERAGTRIGRGRRSPRRTQPTSRRYYNSPGENLIEGLSRSEMDVIESWN